MTNEERYKTPHERSVKFDEFCKHSTGCNTCQAKEYSQGVTIKCYFAWLALEVEEKLIPCPYCGGKGILYRVAGVKPHVQCKACGALMYGNTSTEAIAAWNRRVV